MKATRYRAYSTQSVESRRDVNGEKKNISHDVEHAAFEGRLQDGKAVFDAGDNKISRVVFYGGSGDTETVLGEVSVNKSGKISAEHVEG